jgi:two-component system NtrC family response regulator
MKPSRILVVDDDSSLRRVMKMQLEEVGYQVSLAHDGDEAWTILKDFEPQLVITDLRMPTTGLELLRRISEKGLQTTVIVITAFGTIESAVEAMKMGAYDYVTKPIDFDALVLVVHRAMERQNLIEEVRTLRSALDRRYGFEGIVGNSKGLLRVLDQAARVAERDATVLILGETGTGKELVARAIHHNSRRNNRPFVVINCGAIPADLVESELFGYARGAFTGALTNKTGRIESADGGNPLPRRSRRASFPWARRSSCCASCSKAKSQNSARAHRSKSMSVSLLPLTAISPPWWKTAPSAKTSTTVSPSCR